jgi:sugar/nucleoside kinase (ribokinase family)
MTYSHEELERKYDADFSRGVLVGNNTEIMQLAGNDDVLSAMGFLPNSSIVMHGPEMTAVKRGCSIVTAGTGKIDKKKIKELTGIGDTWEATFIGEVGRLDSASEDDLIKSMKKASKAARKRMLGK